MIYDIIIIGAGPAGMTAAIYARRASKTVLLLEAMTYGGQIINAAHIENFPAEPHISGVDFANKMYEQTVSLGAEFVFEKAIGIENYGEYKKVVTENSSYDCKTVIIATGSDNRKLGIDREEELTGRGVSYCATCDGAFFRGRSVAVVGGGSTAIEDALYLSDMAKTVYLIHRRDTFKVKEELISALKEKQNVIFVLNSTITKLIGEKKLQALEINGNTGEKTTIDAEGLFVAVGRVPENQNFASIIELDKAGYAVASEDCRTKSDGIFVAGDNRTKSVRQLVTAASDGAVAAVAAVNYINGAE